MSAQTVSKPVTIITFALLVNIAMFTTIEFMVRLGKIRLSDTTDFSVANFIRVPEQSREVRSRRDPKAPQKPAQEMQQDIQNLAKASNSAGAKGLTIDLPNIDFDFGSSIEMVREMTPLVRVPPEYPSSALSKGIEGYVVFRFTVTETGTVADPEVLSSEPPGVFDRAARRAILKWKFQPRIIEGKPTRVLTFSRVAFKLADDSPGGGN